MIDFVTELQKLKGLDELPSRIIGILFMENEDISMDELAKRTGYSLSAVCTSMKLLVKSPAITKKRKPGSKKLYFFMEKSVGKSIVKTIEESAEQFMKTIIKRLPKLIENYKKEKPRNYREEVKKLEMYYKEVMIIDEEMKNFKNSLKKRLAEIER